MISLIAALTGLLVFGCWKSEFELQKEARKSKIELLKNEIRAYDRTCEVLTGSKLSNTPYLPANCEWLREE